MTTAYATYSYYSATYLGTAITEANFARLALRASAWIDRLTFQRAATETVVATVDLIKMATCAVAEEIQTVEADGSADGIQSEAIGQNSVTYATSSTKQLTAGEKYLQAAALYLGSTGLMFPGFASGEYSGDPDADE
jgi:hypothetical protein